MGMGRELEGLELASWEEMKDKLDHGISEVGSYIKDVGSGIAESVKDGVNEFFGGIKEIGNNLVNGNIGEALDGIVRSNSGIIGGSSQIVPINSSNTDLPNGKEVGKSNRNYSSSYNT